MNSRDAPGVRSAGEQHSAGASCSANLGFRNLGSTRFVRSSTGFALLGLRLVGSDVGELESANLGAARAPSRAKLRASMGEARSSSNCFSGERCGADQASSTLGVLDTSLAVRSLRNGFRELVDSPLRASRHCPRSVVLPGIVGLQTVPIPFWRRADFTRVAGWVHFRGTFRLASATRRLSLELTDRSCTSSVGRSRSQRRLLLHRTRREIGAVDVCWLCSFRGAFRLASTTRRLSSS